MKRYKKIESWSASNAFNIGWSLSDEVYTDAGCDLTPYGTVCELTQKKNSHISPGQLYHVSEKKKYLGIAIVTTICNIYRRTRWSATRGKYYKSKTTKRIMLLLNEDGRKKIRDRIIKAQL